MNEVPVISSRVQTFQGPHTTALAAGSLVIKGPRQIYIPNPLPLCNNSGAGEATVAVPFIVPIPDVRTRVKITIAFVAAAGLAQPNLTNLANFWLAACDYDLKGGGGGGGRLLPVTDLEGTKAAPTGLSSADLVGYSREFQTSADVILVTPTFSSSTTAGTWMAQFRLQPFDAPFATWEEWEQVKSLFQPTLTGPMGSV